MAERDETSQAPDWSVLPHASLRKRDTSGQGEVLLTADLCGLSAPTLDQQQQIIGQLAVNLAGLMLVQEIGNTGFGWRFDSEVDLQFEDTLDVALALLGALALEVVSTSPQGDIVAMLSPSKFDARVFLEEWFVPNWLYANFADLDEDYEVIEDFEFDFDDAADFSKTREYSLRHFSDEVVVVEPEKIMNAYQGEDGRQIVAKMTRGCSRLEPRSAESLPLWDVMYVVLSVLGFFRMSASAGGLDDNSAGYWWSGKPIVAPSELEVEREIAEYIKEWPDEENETYESERSSLRGEIPQYQFLTESSVFHALGIRDAIYLDTGSLECVMSPPADLRRMLESLDGEPLESLDGELDAFAVDGRVDLGWYGWSFFTPDIEGE